MQLFQNLLGVRVLVLNYEEADTGATLGAMEVVAGVNMP